MNFKSAPDRYDRLDYPHLFSIPYPGLFALAVFASCSLLVFAAFRPEQSEWLIPLASAVTASGVTLGVIDAVDLHRHIPRSRREAENH